MTTARFFTRTVIGFCCFWLTMSLVAAGPDTNSPAETPAKAAENALSNETMRAYLQLAEQIHEAQLSIERTRRESENAASKTAELLAGRLQAIEQSVAAQREAMQSTGKFMLVVLSVFAGAAFLGIVLTAYFQWRTVSRLAEFSSSVPALRPAGFLPGLNEDQLMSAGPVEQSNHRLLGAVERLEKRIHELEHVSQPTLHESATGKNGGDAGSSHPALTAPSAPIIAADPDKSAEIKRLLDQGQALLSSDQADAANECFDEALEMDANNTEALVKKGTALERMRKLAEAIECYDRAIAVDGTMTIAYLYKGGLYNRMERFSEAVECYELALRTQEKRAA